MSPTPQTTRIYKTIKLAPGESFTLPPGSQLMGTTSPGAVTSTCDLADLETLTCYAFVFGTAGDDGNDSQLFEANHDSANVPAVGIKLNGVLYPFSGGDISPDGSGSYPQELLTAINGTSAGQVIFDAQLVNDTGQIDRGSMSYVVFKTLPSIGKDIQLGFSTTAPNFNQGGGGPQYIYFHISARPYTEVAGYNTIPSCS